MYVVPWRKKMVVHCISLAQASSLKASVRPNWGSIMNLQLPPCTRDNIEWKCASFSNLCFGLYKFICYLLKSWLFLELNVWMVEWWTIYVHDAFNVKVQRYAMGVCRARFVENTFIAIFKVLEKPDGLFRQLLMLVLVVVVQPVDPPVVSKHCQPRMAWGSAYQTHHESKKDGCWVAMSCWIVIQVYYNCGLRKCLKC